MHSAADAMVHSVWRGAGVGAQGPWKSRTSVKWGQTFPLAACFLLQVPVSKLVWPVYLPSHASACGMLLTIAALIENSLAARGLCLD